MAHWLQTQLDGRTQQRGHLVSTTESVRNNRLHGDIGDAEDQASDEAAETAQCEELGSGCRTRVPEVTIRLPVATAMLAS